MTTPTEEKIKAEALAIAERAPVIPHISNAEQFQQASALVRETIDLRKELELKQKELLRPLDEGIRGIKAFFKGPLDLVAAREKGIRDELARFQRVERERAAAAAREAEELRRKAIREAQDEADLLALAGDQEGATEAVVAAVLEAEAAAPVVSPLVNTGVGLRTTYSAEVSDFNAFVLWAIQSGRADIYLEVKGPAVNALSREKKLPHGELLAPGLKSVAKEGDDCPMKIYLASSWRNKKQPEVLAQLRAAGLRVYDFRNPEPGNGGFSWSEIDPNWPLWTVEQFNEAISTPIANRGFQSDAAAMAAADACVLLLPSGRSAHMEAAWMGSQGKPVVVYSPTGEYEPELMYKLFTYRICSDIDQVLSLLTGR